MLSIRHNARVDSYLSYLDFRLKESAAKEVYLYGTGFWAKILLSFLSSTGIKVLGLIDDGYGEKSQVELGLPIIRSADVKKPFARIVIASEDYQEEIYNRLRSSGYGNWHIIRVFTSPNLHGLNRFFVSKPKPLKRNNVKRIFFIGDNTDTVNYGCRATSKALEDILSNDACISDRMKRQEILDMFAAIQIVSDFGVYMAAVKKYNSSEMDCLVERIKRVDAVVMNGEGSFILKSPPRKDLHKYALIMLACIEAERPFYVVNAMFSAYANEVMNDNLMDDILQILEHASFFSTRDQQSLELIKTNNSNIKAGFVPDALFSWHSVLTENGEALRQITANPQFSMPFAYSPEFYQRLDFSEGYVLLSGNSYAAAFQNQAEEAFYELAIELNRRTKKLGLRLYLIECCSGDAFLRAVSRKAGLPLIPSTTNIYMAMWILANAQCLVSGRYHPSILASLGGTPCVFMKANSHKTESLQAVLNIDPNERDTFSAVPDKTEIHRIADAFEKALKQDRERIKAECCKNAVFARGIWETIMGAENDY